MGNKKNLVILSDNIGLNFSGGAIATCRIFQTIQHSFEKVILIGKQLGDHSFSNYEFLQWNTKQEAINYLQAIPVKNAVFYGDFYMADYFTFLDLPFFFTYHDNWPDQQRFGKENQLLSTFFIPIYHRIFSRALHIATVSEFKLNYVQQFTEKASLIRNGINMIPTKTKPLQLNPNEPLNVLMLGNIDDRKYSWAVDVFHQLAAKANINVHIYGHQNDSVLAQQLNSFSFVQLMGFQRTINFSDYHLLLMTSKIENLSISVCDALANHTPVLCFDVGGLKEVIQHKANGWLVPEGDVQQMANVLQQIANQQITFNFEQQDLSEFDWQLAGNQYLTLFNQYA